jgi:RHS repeat-associated protein
VKSLLAASQQIFCAPPFANFPSASMELLETTATGTTQYLVDTLNPTGYAQVVDELQSGSVTRHYTWGLELIAESQIINQQWTTSFYGFDGHGSVRTLTNASGVVTDTYDYDAFGVLISSTGSTPNNYRFAGEQFDPALGTYYNRARYYDERNGRFWSMDKYEGNDAVPASLHKYVYSSAEPVDFTDPTGFITNYTPYGYAIELRIRIAYLTDYIGNDVLLGQPTRLGANPLLKPDIFDKTRHSWTDIKPFSFAGIADAIATVERYTENFAPIGYVADPTWEPSDQPLEAKGKLFYVKNVSGILFYTIDTDRKRLDRVKDFASARQLLNELQREQFSLYFNLSLVGSGIGYGIAAIINAATAADSAEIGAQTGAAILEDAA